ncbi:MAG: acyltransferase [Candidatus Erginobacter occultus]|nr:acyltransferase [Candidatus Erginobacter occultus]
MTGYDGEGTIPPGSFRESFRIYRERVYGSGSIPRFLGQGLFLTLFSAFPTVAGSLLRGRIYGLILGGAGRKCFLEKNIRLFNPAGLFLGDRVFLGEGTFIDVGPAAGPVTVGDDSHLARQVTIRIQSGKVKIGKQVNIGAGSFIYGYGDIEIGDYCLIANGVETIGGDHTVDDLSRPMRFQGRSEKGIAIAADVWIGTRAVILGGVTVGEGAVIGAGAVVTSDIPPRAVAAGVPARVLRFRGEKESADQYPLAPSR